MVRLHADARPAFAIRAGGRSQQGAGCPPVEAGRSPGWAVRVAEVGTDDVDHRLPLVEVVLGDAFEGVEPAVADRRLRCWMYPGLSTRFHLRGRHSRPDRAMTRRAGQPGAATGSSVACQPVGTSRDAASGAVAVPGGRCPVVRQRRRMRLP